MGWGDDATTTAFDDDIGFGLGFVVVICPHEMSRRWSGVNSKGAISP